MAELYTWLYHSDMDLQLGVFSVLFGHLRQVLLDVGAIYFESVRFERACQNYTCWVCVLPLSQQLALCPVSPSNVTLCFYMDAFEPVMLFTNVVLIADCNRDTQMTSKMNPG